MKTKILLISVMLMLLSVTSFAQSGWDAHLKQLTSAVKVKAGIFGIDHSQWAGKATLTLPMDELKYIILGFDKPDNIKGSGAKINGTTYKTIKADKNLMVFKHGMDGAVCYKTAKAVIVSKFNEADATPAQVVTATQKFADYLKKLGY